MKDTIKQSIIRYIEEQGEVSKSKLEDYMRGTCASTSDVVCRRLRELVASGVIQKEQKTYNDKKYFSYRVVEEELNKCNFCSHGRCPSCNFCHNMDCNNFIRPPNSCFDILLPKLNL